MFLPVVLESVFIRMIKAAEDSQKYLSFPILLFTAYFVVQW